MSMSLLRIKYWQQEIIPSLPPLKVVEDDENLHGIIATVMATDYIPKKFEEFENLIHL